MSDDKTHPHCPRCGGLPEWHEKHSTTYTYGCDDCGFGDPSGDTMYSPQGWRQAVRAELARQALELRAHAHHTRPSRYDGSAISDWPSPASTWYEVLSYYEWLGKKPPSLPGEENDA